MENKSTPVTHVNSVYGRIDFKLGTNGCLVLCQCDVNGVNNRIVLNPKDEVEKLARALFKKKQELVPSVKPKKAQAKPKVQQQTTPAQPKGTGPSYMEQQKAKYENAYNKWTNDDEALLKRYHSEGKTNAEISGLLKRNTGAVRSRLKKLGLTGNNGKQTDSGNENSGKVASSKP